MEGREDEAVVVERRSAAERFVGRGVAALVAVVAVGVGFGVLTVAARARWEPLQEADQAVADRLVRVVAEQALLREILLGVTDLGATITLMLVLAVAALWLLVRGQPRLAGYMILTGAGGLLLNGVVKELVARLRPVVETPVHSAGGWSFPSGHAMSSLICYGVLVLVFAPSQRVWPRRILVGAVVAIVAVIGGSRVALGVHYVSDVLGGWLLGALWLVLTTVAFQRWRRDSGVRDAGPLPGAVPPDSAQELRPVPAPHPSTLPHPWLGMGELAVAWVLLVGLVLGLGLAVRALEDGVLRWDLGVVAWLSEHRDPVLTSVLGVFGHVGNTLAIITAALVVAALAVAVLRSWRPVLFLGVALLGEITAFLTLSAIVDRDRPRVVPLDPDLPPTSSFPSGHVAASVTLYAGTAALLWATDRRRWRLLAAVLLLVPVLVAAQRLYAGAHHPTDVLGALVLASAWTSIAWWVVRPLGARAPSPQQHAEPAYAHRIATEARNGRDSAGP
ncbi:phosphatase PAP2 family protein [Nocardia sp. NPDC048505]|uniref:phosphatase PAP2 family protein n=1 Tax=unclassified Nocardia TaxID=2637762 RepID=UPI00340C00FE